MSQRWWSRCACVVTCVRPGRGARAAARPRTRPGTGSPSRRAAGRRRRSRRRSRGPTPQVQLQAVEQTGDVDPDAQGGVGERPDQPGPDRALVVGGVALGRAPAVVRAVGRVDAGSRERRPSDVSERERHASTCARSADRAVRQRDREQPVGPQRRRRRRRAVDDVQEAELVGPGEAAGGTSRGRALRRPSQRSTAPAGTPDRLAPTASALIQSAWISTAFPGGPVTGSPSMRASIQVSATPSAPWRSRPSAGSARSRSGSREVAAQDLRPIRRRARRRCRRRRSPRRGGRWRAGTTARRPTVLYSRVPVSAVLASMPSETVAPARSRTARPSLVAFGRKEQPLVGVIESRDHSPNHG